MITFATNRHWLVVAAMLFCLTAQAKYTDHRNRKVDSLEHVLSSNQKLSDQQLMDAYKSLMWGYLQTDGQKAADYARKTIALSYRHDWQNSRSDGLRILGLLAYGSNRFDEAADYYQQALAVTDSMRGNKKYNESDIDDNLSGLYGSLGNLYNMQDKLLLAIEYYQKAMPIFEKYEWKESLTILHHNVAELYLSMGNNEKARKHYLEAIETARQTGDSLIMALPRKGLVKIYIGEDDYEQARQTIEPAFAYYSAHRDEEPGDYAEVLTAMAKLCLMSGHENVPQAKAYIKEAIGYDNDEVETEVHRDIYAVATMTAMREQNWPLALQYALKSIHKDEENDTYSDVGCYEQLANIYMQMGQKEKAAHYINKVCTVMERFATSHYQSGLSQMEVLYETEKKQATINQLQQEKRWYLWGAVLTALVLQLTALLFFLLWRSARLKKESALVKARLDGEVAERSRLARDLHDALGGMLSLLRLKTESLPLAPSERGGKQKEEVLQLLDETARELRYVAHNLMPEQLLQGGLTEALNDFAHSVPGAQFHHLGSDERLGQELEVVLYRCAYELVNNAIKHAAARHIDMQLMQQRDQVTLTVSDDGSGLTTTAQDGMGLQNIRERISHYGGSLSIVSKEDKGTEINVTLPL